jgi:putative transposase
MSNDTVDSSKPILKRDTYTCLKYHIVFATHCRRRLINKDWRPRVHAYIAGILRKLGAVPLIVGGVSDHVHILTGLRPNHCLSDVMR